MKTKRVLSFFLCLLLTLGLLAVPAAALEPLEVQVKAALLVDQNTGGIVYAKNEHEELYPASLTKIMTSLLVLEAIDQGRLSLTQAITVPASALAGMADDGSTAGIKEGEILTVEQLLYCMLVVSANEACTILAEQVSGSVDAFVEAMNAKAKELGCDNTHFMNPHGYHDPQHYTSAWDLYLITTAAMEYPLFMTICDTASITIPATNLSPERPLYNTNYLICGYRSRGYLNENAHGVKTGSHSQAGHCLVATAQKASLRFISVVLGGERVQDAEGTWWTYSFLETNNLYKWAFENFTYQTILKESDVAGEAAVSLSGTDHVTLRPAGALEVLLPKDQDPAELERVITLKSDPIEAPIAEGDVLGTLTLRLDGKDYASVDLLALNDVEASRIRILWRDIKEFFSKLAVKITCGVIAGLVVLWLVWKVIFSKRRYRYGRRVSKSSNGYRGKKH